MSGCDVLPVTSSTSMSGCDVLLELHQRQCQDVIFCHLHQCRDVMFCQSYININVRMWYRSRVTSTSMPVMWCSARVTSVSMSGCDVLPELHQRQCQWCDVLPELRQCRDVMSCQSYINVNVGMWCSAWVTSMSMSGCDVLPELHQCQCRDVMFCQSYINARMWCDGPAIGSVHSYQIHLPTPISITHFIARPRINCYEVFYDTKWLSSWKTFAVTL